MSEPHAGGHEHPKDHLAKFVDLHEQYKTWRETLKQQHASVYLKASQKHLESGKAMHKLKDAGVRDKFVDDLVNQYMELSGLKPKNDFERDAFLNMLIGYTREGLSRAVGQAQENYVLDLHKATTDKHIKNMEEVHLSTVHKPLIEYAKDHAGRKKLFKEAGLDSLVSEAEKMTDTEAADHVLQHFGGAGAHTYKKLVEKYSSTAGSAHHH